MSRDMPRRPWLDSCAIPVAVASWVTVVFLLYKLFSGEKARPAVSFVGFCILFLVLVLNKAKTLSQRELKFVGFTCLMTAVITASAVLNGVQ